MLLFGPSCMAWLPPGSQLASFLAPSADSNCSFLFNGDYDYSGVPLYAQMVRQLAAPRFT